MKLGSTSSNLLILAYPIAVNNSFGDVYLTISQGEYFLCEKKPSVFLRWGFEQATLDQNCTGQGGTPGTACPSANLVGCCNFGGATETCYYDNDPSQALEASNCSAAGGTWQTTP